jgi:hypothetical protein
VAKILLLTLPIKRTIRKIVRFGAKSTFLLVEEMAMMIVNRFVLVGILFAAALWASAVPAQYSVLFRPLDLTGLKSV